MLATVYGDVHDIGKSLVNTILSNNGYTVFDLGKQVPVNTIIDKAIEVGADAIGLSALLVSTSKQMPLCVQELDRRGLDDSGADRRRGDQSALRPARAVRRRRARVRAGRLLLQGCVRGTRDDGSLSRTPRRARAFVGEAHRRRAERHVPAHERRQGHRRRRRRRRSGATSPPTTRCRRRRSSVRRCCATFRSTKCFALLDLDELYRLQWGGRGSGPEYEATVREEFEPTLERPEGATRSATGGSSRRPCTATSPCSRSGNDLIVYDPARVRERRRRCARSTRFHFPRQEGRERLCLADYFRSVGIG